MQPGESLNFFHVSLIFSSWSKKQGKEESRVRRRTRGNQELGRSYRSQANQKPPNSLTRAMYIVKVYSSWKAIREYAATTEKVY